MHAEITVSRVTTATQRREFLELPARLYAHDPCWVPRLLSSEQELVGFRKHAFQDHASTVAFLATRKGRTCGRILAVDLRKPSEHKQDESRGFVGFFESVDDTEVAAELFEQAAAWLRSKGRSTMRGPVNPSMNYEAGLLVEGFESDPAFMMPHNLPYYQRLWEHAGFEQIQDLFAYRAHRGMLGDLDEKVRYISRMAAERFGVQFRPVERRRFREDARTFLQIYNQSSANTWGFLPLTESEIQQLSKELKYLIVPEITTLAMVEGEVIGAAFGLLDYNSIIRQIRGRLFPFGFMHLLAGRKRIKRARVMSANVVPKYQGWGVGVALMGQLATQAMQLGLDEVEFSYVVESNRLARRSLEHGGALRAKTYRVYEKGI